MKIHSAPKRLYHSNDAWCDLFACGSLEVFHKRLFAAEKWGWAAKMGSGHANL